MCEPTTMMMVMTAASGLMQYQSQAAQAKYQNKLAIQNAESARQSAIESYKQSALRDIQEEKAATQKIEQEQEAYRRAQSAARVSAGEAGVSGLSVDALQRDIAGDYASNVGTIQENLQMAQAQSGMDRRGYEATAKSRVNRAASGMLTKPSAVGTALSIGAQAYQQYKSANPSTSSTRTTKQPTAQQLSGPF